MITVQLVVKIACCILDMDTVNAVVDARLCKQSLMISTRFMLSWTRMKAVSATCGKCSFTMAYVMETWAWRYLAAYIAYWWRLDVAINTWTSSHHRSWYNILSHSPLLWARKFTRPPYTMYKYKGVFTYHFPSHIPSFYHTSWWLTLSKSHIHVSSVAVL